MSENDGSRTNEEAFWQRFAEFTGVNAMEDKPNPEYYRELLRSLGAAPEECVMVGNDVKEDMAAETLGVRCFLLTDCLINPDHADVSRWEHGGFPLLQNFLRNLK